MGIRGALDYEPRFCDEVTEMMRYGATVEEVAAKLRAPIRTLKVWIEAFPEFRDAMELGITLSTAWWYKQGRRNLENPMFNAGLYKLNMANLHGWAGKSEKRVITEEVTDGGSKGKAQLDTSPKARAKVLEILREVNVLSLPAGEDDRGTGADGSADAEVVSVHTAHSHTKTRSVSAP